MRTYTREELLALTPEVYLSDGYLGRTGRPHPELVADFATAATEQLRLADLPSQELAFTYEALRLVLAQQEGSATERARAAVREALETVMRMTRQTNNEGLSKRLDACVAAIRRPEDIDALLQHMRAVLRLYTIMASLPDDGVSSLPARPS
jgi:hypothetical protein